MVKANSCIFIDAGTTNLALAQALSPDLNITVVTNAPDIAALLINHPAAEVIMLGGQIQKSTGDLVDRGLPDRAAGTFLYLPAQHNHLRSRMVDQ